MNEIRTDRRGFLKGLLGISIAAVTLPLLPPVTAAPESISILPAAEIEREIEKVFGRLGRVKIEDAWFPLEDASISMYRRHVPPLHRLGSNMVTYETAQSTSLVNSPWQIEVWSPDMSIHRFFDGPDRLSFEFETGAYGFSRPVNFTGVGYITTIENVITRGIDEGQEQALFSLILEGDEKLKRYGDS